MTRARLEGAVMDLLWDHAEGLTAAEVRTLLHREGAPPALTTVHTALTRLAAKGRVRPVEGGRPRRFRAAVTREAHTAELLRDLLGSAPDREAVLAAFVGGISETDSAALRRLLD